MKGRYRLRRLTMMSALAVVVAYAIMQAPDLYRQVAPVTAQHAQAEAGEGEALTALDAVPIKGRAPKTGYARTQFGDGWANKNGCDTRNIILNRDLTNVLVGDGCKVLSGTLNDPYTGKTIVFKRGANTSADVQIDHVVALSDAWQKGAQQLTAAERVALANDPLELIAVDGQANQDKSDGDAATWLPPNKAFRCQYVARQVAVKAKYRLWMTQAEHDSIRGILEQCPGQQLPVS